MDSTPLGTGLLLGFVFHDGRPARVTDESCAEAPAAPHDWTWKHFALADRARLVYQEMDSRIAAL